MANINILKCMAYYAPLFFYYWLQNGPVGIWLATSDTNVAFYLYGIAMINPNCILISLAGLSKDNISWEAHQLFSNLNAGTGYLFRADTGIIQCLRMASWIFSNTHKWNMNQNTTNFMKTHLEPILIHDDHMHITMFCDAQPLVLWLIFFYLTCLPACVCNFSYPDNLFSYFYPDK